MGDRKVSVLGAYLAASVVVTGGQAIAHSHGGSHAAKHRHGGATASAERGHHHHRGQFLRVAYHHNRFHGAYGAHVIQCVAFAKADAGILISGNARDWWGRAAGIYDRGSRPEPGSVLSFRSTGRMPLGHVAVVSGIEDSRTIVIDQSHWGSRGITRDIEVKDVSQNNDWSAVRVQLGHGAAFGSIYPTHGFIYPRPDRGTTPADEARVVPVLASAANEARVRPMHASFEVAEVPTTGKALDLRITSISFDAPNRSLR